jgi:hypothetical protein
MRRENIESHGRRGLELAGLSLVAGLLVAACQGSTPTTPDPDFNEHEWIESSRQFAGIRGVVLAMPGDLTIEQAPGETLWIRGDRSVLPGIIAQVNNGILEIRLEPGTITHPGRPTEFVLSTPILESADLADYGVIRGVGLRVDRLSLRLTGTGELEFTDLDASELRVSTMQGGGSVSVSGRVHTQRVELSGVAGYYARDLVSSRARVDIFGVGSATVRVSDQLTASITGAGSIYYLGDPEVESTVTGTGRVVPLGQ